MFKHDGDKETVEKHLQSLHCFDFVRNVKLLFGALCPAVVAVGDIMKSRGSSPALPV